MGTHVPGACGDWATCRSRQFCCHMGQRSTLTTRLMKRAFASWVLELHFSFRRTFESHEESFMVSSVTKSLSPFWVPSQFPAKKPDYLRKFYTGTVTDWGDHFLLPSSRPFLTREIDLKLIFLVFKLPSILTLTPEHSIHVWFGGVLKASVIVHLGAFETFIAFYFWYIGTA